MKGTCREDKAPVVDACCTDKSSALAQLGEEQKARLRAVLYLNGAMFIMEFIAGLLAGSVALLADSLDMLGDALVYGLSLYVVGLGPVWKARAALAKAVVMGLFGIIVLGQIVAKLVHPHVPAFEVMGVVGALALIANGICFGLLWRHRADDINMRSVWMCSRNDLIANVSVLFAAGAVWVMQSPWPDILVGLLISAVFLRSALAVTREAHDELVLIGANK
jgi:cation diffusion facilitator family transporter